VFLFTPTIPWQAPKATACSLLRVEVNSSKQKQYKMIFAIFP
jgi:hypothetical protein